MYSMLIYLFLPELSSASKLADAFLIQKEAVTECNHIAQYNTLLSLHQRQKEITASVSFLHQ